MSSSSSSSQRPTLIRLARYDTPDAHQFVLLHATPTSAVHPLNLRLHATEGERAFATDITQSKIYDLRARSYTGTSEDLEKIFLALLLKQDVGVERGVELAAAVDAKGVTLTVRQDIGGIKQRIAALQIPEEEVEIPIFEWAVEACGDLNSGSSQLGSLQRKVGSQKREIETLTNQLKDLAAFKKEHEEQLLVKFSELLNSKKAKIRELSRELDVKGGDAVSSKADSPVTVDETEVAEPAPARGRGGRGRGRGRGRAKAAAPPRKRKPIAPPTDSESDGFVKMEMDSKGRPSPDDETEDSEEEAGPSRGYLRQDARSDRSITEDEDYLPPVRKPIAFTIKSPDPVPERTPDEDVEMDESPPAQPSRTSGRARGGGGKGKAPASPPTSRGKRRATRSKPKEQSPSPSSVEYKEEGDTEDSEDDEL